jgi:HPt (histidine-containing phosphotransfer) domain-containing protein
MATLLSKVRAITKSTTTETSNTNVVEFLKSAAHFVLTGIPKELLWPLASNSDTITDGSGCTVYSDTILEVRRNGIACDEIPNEYAYAHESALTVDSLHERTAIFPGYFTRSGKVYIKPDPTVGSAGVVVYLPIPTISTTTDADSWTFRRFSYIIIDYAASLDFMALSGYWRNQGESEIADIVTDVSTSLTNYASAIPTWSTVTMDTITHTISTSLPTFSAKSYTVSTADIDDAFDKAQSYMDNLTTIDFEDWIASGTEEIEMANTLVNGAAQEINRARTAIEIEQMNITKYSNDIRQEIDRVNNEINKYRAESEKESQRIEISIINKYQAAVNGEAKRFEDALAKASAYLQEAQTRVASAQNVAVYIQNAQSLASQAKDYYLKASEEIKNYVENNSKMINLRAQIERR